jgi:triphosphoribosyl-dephospho-CoA synthase
MTALSAGDVAFLAQAACLLEASAPKPGNVSPGRDLADLRFEDFAASAVAIGPAFAQAGEVGLGATILAAIRAVRSRVATNTNLGIVLLLAPLARAALRDGGPLRERLCRVLAESTVEDARDVYAAIRLAQPGGLGMVSEEDVASEPTRPLRDVMALARERDGVASEYASDYDRTFRSTVPALLKARSEGADWRTAALRSFLRVLGEAPDSLIARKNGPRVAAAVSRKAAALDARDAAAVAAFDAELRGARWNPGTTADLVAAGLFVALAEEL